MFSSLLSRLHPAKLATVVLLAAQMLGWSAPAQSSDDPSAAMPPSNALITVRRALREFDRFLDHHPLLEDELRLKPALVADQAFLKKNPELHEFLRTNQEVPAGLGLYPRYFLHRALLRQANAPLRYSEIAQLKDILDANPTLELALVQKPESIRNADFLAAHAPLRDFLTIHPTLGPVFLPRRELPAKSP